MTAHEHGTNDVRPEVTRRPSFAYWVCQICERHHYDDSMTRCNVCGTPRGEGYVTR